LLGNFEKHFGHTQSLFFALTYFSRLLCFVGFLCCASLLGIVDRRDKIVFGLIVCFISFLDGDSYAGTGGLFLNYFTHSEIANGTVLLAIYFAAKNRFAAATAMCGVTFFINAFVAFWLVPLLACVAASLLWERKATLAGIARQTLAGLLPCVLLAIPVLSNIASNPEFGKPLDFDFVSYLHQYFAGHVLIGSISTLSMFGLAAVTLLGAVSLYWFGAGARELQAAYCGAILLYAIGIAARSSPALRLSLTAICFDRARSFICLPDWPPRRWRLTGFAATGSQPFCLVV
jgi:heme exporter protein D